MYVLNKGWNGKGLSQGGKPGTGGLINVLVDGLVSVGSIRMLVCRGSTVWYGRLPINIHISM